MFTHVKAAWARADLTSPIQQVVLLFLADRANDNGMMRWSVPNIAKACRSTDRTVRTVLKELYDNGVIGSESEPQAGAVTHWLVPDDPFFLYRTPVAISRVRKRGRKPTPVTITTVEDTNPGSNYRATPVIVAPTPVIVAPTPVAITDKANRSKQKQPEKQILCEPASAGTPPDDLKESVRYEWVSGLRKQFDALPVKKILDANKEVRLAVEKFGQDGYDCWRALIAGNHGDYLPPSQVSGNIGKWKAAGRPPAYALFGRSNGATNGAYQSHSRSLPTNDEFEQERLELEAKRRAATERRNRAAVG